MSKDNDLIEGLTIMSPSEVANYQNAPEGEGASTEGGEGGEGQQPEGEGPEFSVTPGRQNTTEPTGGEEGGAGSGTEEPPANTPPAQTEIGATKKQEIFKALVTEFKEKGGFEGLDKEEIEGTLEELMEMANKTAEKKFESHVEQWKNGFSGAKKRFLELEGAFTDEDMAFRVAQDLEFFNTVTDEALAENVDLQKNIYGRSLAAKGFSQQEINTAIEDAETLDKLAEKAKAAFPGLKQGAENFVTQSRQQTEAAREQALKAQEQNFNKMMTSIDDAESFVDGIKLNKTSREKLKANITTVVHTDEQGRQYNSLGHKQLSNPMAFETLINYYDSIGLFNLDKDGNFKPDLAKLKKVAETQAATRLDDILSQEDKEVGQQYSEVEGSKRKESILNILEQGMGGRKKR